MHKVYHNLKQKTDERSRLHIYFCKNVDGAWIETDKYAATNDDMNDQLRKLLEKASDFWYTKQRVSELESERLANGHTWKCSKKERSLMHC